MTLYVGSEELLLRRAAEQLLDELRAAGELEVLDVRAPDLKDDGLPDLRTASLFGTPRAVLVREAQELPSEIAAELLALLDAPPPDTHVILLASGVGRIQKLSKRVADVGGRIDVAAPKEWEEGKWRALVADEFARHGRRASADAVHALLAHAGLDVASVAEKVAQVAASAPPGQVSAAHVDAVVVGHGSRGSFAVADAMCERRPRAAIELLRGVLEAGDDPVMVLGALAYRLRSLVAVAAGVDARSVGLNISPGQARRLKALRANFGPGELTGAYDALAQADVAIKSGELPAQLVLERAVVAVATPRP